jgi:hypothetical protein
MVLVDQRLVTQLEAVAVLGELAELEQIRGQVPLGLMAEAVAADGLLTVGVVPQQLQGTVAQKGQSASFTPVQPVLFRLPVPAIFN